MKTITADIPFQQPPLWALLERQLIDLMNEAVDPLLEKYVHEDGRIMWPTDDDHIGVDALDDAYESFHNWPLFYLLGGSGRFLELSHKHFNAITEQFTHYDTGFGHPMVVKEYEQGYDWFHQGEGYLFYYLLCLADPLNPLSLERAKRYAGFYLNEDPEALNYDEQVNILKCAHTGSMGPAHRNFTGEPWLYEDWKQWFGLPFLDIPGVETIEDLKDPKKAELMGKAMQERQSIGDVAVNLAVTTLIANAYLMTGEAKYKDWIRTYTDGWLKRIELNGGIIPDNIGLNGKIGEYTNGKWYGGYYGWIWPHGWVTIGDALVIAGENGMLLFQDPKYLDLPRSQIDVLMRQGIVKNETLYVPHKHGDPNVSYKYNYEGALRFENGDLFSKDGWFEYLPLDARYSTHIWNMSMDTGDLERLKQIRNPQKNDWTRICTLRTKDQGGHEAAWVAYLTGEFPDYPEQILLHNLQQVYSRLQFMRDDQQDPLTYRDWYLQERNPITAEGLTHLTMGAPLPDYNGGLLMTRVRYYDLQRNRPGLPDHVGALVERMDTDSLSLRLVNLSVAASREMVIYAGAFGEHQFTSVSYPKKNIENKQIEDIIMNDHQFRVHLLPGCEISLTIQMERFVNNPSYILGD